MAGLDLSDPYVSLPMKQRDPDFISPPRIFDEDGQSIRRPVVFTEPPPVVKDKAQTAPVPQTKTEAATIFTTQGAVRQTQTAGVSPLLIGGVLAGLVGLFFLSK